MDLISPDIGMIVWNIALVVAAVLFLLAQHRALKAVSPANRELSPGEVWFQLIPVFNLYWQFVVTTRIADSLLKEQLFLAAQDDSILGMPDPDAVEAIGDRPTYRIGMAACSLLLLAVLLPRLGFFRYNYTWPWQVLNISMLLCYILYWIDLVRNTRRILLQRKKQIL